MMRALLMSAATAVAVSSAGCTSSQVNTQSREEAAAPSASRVRAECPNFKDVAVKQQTPVWCWAASAEMVHKYYGNTEITQDALAQQITNVSGTDAKKAKAAGLQQIMVALNPDYSKRVAQHSAKMIQDGSVKVDVIDMALGQLAPWSSSSDELIDAIATQNPAIVGLRGEGQSMGHAVVVYASSYEPEKNQEGNKVLSGIFGAVAKDLGAKKGVRADQVDAAGVAKGPAKYRLSEVEYIDPMDGKRYKLNAEGFKNRVDFIMTKDKAREILDRQLNAVN